MKSIDETWVKREETGPRNDRSKLQTSKKFQAPGLKDLQAEITLLNSRSERPRELELASPLITQASVAANPLEAPAARL